MVPHDLEVILPFYFFIYSHCGIISSLLLYNFWKFDLILHQNSLCSISTITLKMYPDQDIP